MTLGSNRLDYSIAHAGRKRCFVLRTRGGAHKVCLPRAGIRRTFSAKTSLMKVLNIRFPPIVDCTPWSTTSVHGR